jgi:hypothetical protein
MPYIDSSGNVVDNRSWLRFSIITDFLWSIANGISLFVNTLINPQAPIPRRMVTSRSSTPASKNTTERRGPNIRTMKEAQESAKACSTGS